MNILCIGDIVGRPGREALAKILPLIKTQYAVDFTIVNGENAAGGSGILPKQAQDIFAAGADVITLGDHVWDKAEIKEYLNQSPRIVRPANFPDGAPGRGWTIAVSAAGVKVGVINLLGRTFMRYNVTCPFRCLDAAINDIKPQTPVIIVDMHAETTSEKVALGHYGNGRASLMFGTHTHIQTADEKVLSGGTAYITDLGMSGPYDSVIGQDKVKIIQRFLTSLPHKFEVAQGAATLHGVVVTVDAASGKATHIRRIQQKDPACGMV
ncbi:MAG: TIGR00282 family metallophosphoesterase [Candidatus Omnitrophica bacterium]|nr:TIGR00282 family metallophosphoesterase [Candidatus Omnitrophota bacterium]